MGNGFRMFSADSLDNCDRRIKYIGCLYHERALISKNDGSKNEIIEIRQDRELIWCVWDSEDDDGFSHNSIVSEFISFLFWKSRMRLVSTRTCYVSHESLIHIIHNNSTFFCCNVPVRTHTSTCTRFRKKLRKQTENSTSSETKTSCETFLVLELFVVEKEPVILEKALPWKMERRRSHRSLLLVAAFPRALLGSNPRIASPRATASWQHIPKGL